jgi:hypothetical protein
MKWKTISKKIIGRRPQKKKWKTTSNKKWKTTSTKKGRRPKKIKENNLKNIYRKLKMTLKIKNKTT